jgi:xanthine dehydrogenase accessory factor
MPANESPRNQAHSQSISEAVSRILEHGSLAVLATLIEAAPSTRESVEQNTATNPEVNVGSKLLIEFSAAEVKTVGGFGSDELDRAVAQHARQFLDSKTETRVFRVKEFSPLPGDWSDWSEGQILFERIQLEPRLVICGAGHVGASLGKLAALLGYHATLIDDRSEFVSRESFPDQRIELVAASSWSEAVRTAVGNGHGVCVAIVTRGHSEDEQCLRAVMEVDADYVGLIGSKRRTNIVLDRLRESGAAAERLGKVHAPVGLDIGAVTPEEVALAIMAEIVAVRRGGKGGSLSEWRREKRGAKGE